MTALLLLTHFLIGFTTSFLGTIPPGAINIEVLRLSMFQNFKTVLNFIIATMVAELIYTYIAVLFSGYLISLPKLEYYIQLLSIPVFTVIGLSYFFMKNNITDTNKSTAVEQNLILKGLSFGFFNPLQIPFWITYCSYYLSVGWINDDSTLLTIFVAGALLGSFSMLVLISKFSNIYIKQMNLKMKWVNSFLGILFLIMATYQLGNILISD